MAKPKISGVYCIRNKVNGKCYIGSTTDLYTRFWTHKTRLRANRHDNWKLQDDFNKYGEEYFIFEILKELPSTITKQELYKYEQYFIDKTEQIYNILPFAGSSRDRKYRTESIKRMSISHIGHKQSAETKAKRSAIMKGRTLTSEQRMKISESKKGKYTGLLNPRYGKHMSEETKQKIANAQIRKPVICIETNIVYCGVNEAARQVGCHNIHITDCCKGRRQTCSGYHWEYYKE